MSKKPNNNISVFTGNANPGLAGKICDFLGVRPSAIVVDRFSDG